MSVWCSRLTLRVLLLLFSLSRVDDHPSFKALQETRGLLPLLDLNLNREDVSAGNRLLMSANLPRHTHPSVYLCSSLLVQLHRHERRRSLLADGGVPALPEEVAAFFLSGSRCLQLLRVLSLPNCERKHPSEVCGSTWSRKTTISPKN